MSIILIRTSEGKSLIKPQRAPRYVNSHQIYYPEQKLELV